MEKMLVTQALNELKTLGSRIDRAIAEADFITASKVSEKNAAPGKTKDVFNKEAKTSMQQINDLIERREKIKAAVIASNAVTEVEIGGVKMTVAKAIDTKDSIEFKQDLLNMMKAQYAQAMKKVEDANQKMEKKIDDLVTTAYGKDGKDKIQESDFDAIAKPYRSANETGLVDPLGIEKKIKELSEYIEAFKSNVDSVLQISNCTTFIEV